MLATTDAIVLALQPHSDKAHLLHVYTRTHGRVNLLVFGLGRKHAIGTYQPFSVIQITADFRLLFFFNTSANFHESLPVRGIIVIQNVLDH